jgi:uncharacterized membrane protein
VNKPGVDTPMTPRAENIAVLVSAAVAPGTFARSLGPRSALDQGLVTGLTTSITYVLTVASQDLLGSLAAGGATDPAAVRRRLLLVDAAVVPLAFAVGRALPVRDDESTPRSLTRQAAWRVGMTGLGSLLFEGAGRAAERVDRRLGATGDGAGLPLAIPTGMLVAAAVEWRRRQAVPDEPASPGAPVIASAAVGAGTAAGLAGLALAERRLASGVGKALERQLPGTHRSWRLAGHLAALLAIGGGASALWSRAMHRIEAGVAVVDPALQGADERWVPAGCSGSTESLVPWSTLGREGRRHVVAAVRSRELVGRPEGMPDLSVPAVMGRPAVADPVQVYVGLDSAPTIRDRVALALSELDRAGAWERSLIMLCSPTGTGYVNYCAVAATQYLALGDVATVTMQYAKRPSPVALGKIADAREQNRLLWLEIAERVRKLAPERRPRIVLFGESLGAHTSQDVFMHWGTLGLQALGIDRALWVGTPYSSRWMRQVTMSSRPDTDPAAVAVVNDFGQVLAMTPEDRARLRYVLLSHDNDGVTKFGADLLMRSPRWLRDARVPIENVPPYSERGTPAGMRWRPITTFFQLLVDMKNAQAPGGYEATRHDYRPDLPRFISETYGLKATEDELARVEAAVVEREAARQQLFGPAGATPQP